MKRRIGCFAAILSAMLLSAGCALMYAGQENLAQILMGGAIAAMLVAMLMKGAQQAAHESEKSGFAPEDSRSAGLSFRDVAANEAARASLAELADYLKEPKKYEKYGVRMPRGVLLYGPPGTGKTLLARALAGEAGVPFFSMSGSDFVELYVGVGAGRVRDLFKKARKAGRCVIFIDEIDAMAGKRSDKSSDERDQTLNALLSEMSGFRENSGVIVVAATNRIASMDPALLRPGRFDRQIEVGLPGIREREEILRLHGKNKPLGRDVDLSSVAAMTVRFSGAALETLLNEAALTAARKNAPEIAQEHVREAYVKAVAGSEKGGRSPGREKRAVAIHEAGHALVLRKVLPGSRLERVSILGAGSMAGYNLAVPKDTDMPDRDGILREILVSLAGRAAEETVLGQDRMTAGASGDLERAAELAGNAVMRLGMDGEPSVSLDAVARIAGRSGDGEQRIRALLAECYEIVKKLIRDNAEDLLRIAARLLVKEALTGEEVDELIQKNAG